MAAATNLILRYVLEADDEDDLKDVAYPGHDPEALATAIYQRLINEPFDGADYVELAGVNFTLRRSGARMLVTIRSPEREPLKHTGAKSADRKVYFTWPAREQFFINTLARKIAHVLADEPRRDRIEKLYREVEAMAGSPRYQEWSDAVQDEKVEGHTTDYGKMTQDDIDFWFEFLKKFRGEP